MDREDHAPTDANRYAAWKVGSKLFTLIGAASKTAMAKTIVYTQVTITEVYIGILEKMVDQLRRNDALTRPDLVPFVVTCAAALECILNETVIKYSSREYGPDNYRKYAEAFISMSLRGKVDVVVPLLSKNHFVLRNGYRVYTSLIRLISLRNTLMHNKPFLEKHEVDVTVDAKGHPNAIVRIDTLSKYGFQLEYQDCIGIWEAIKAFEQTLSSYASWQENDIIAINPEQV